jgi:hypothetical protein
MLKGIRKGLVLIGSRVVTWEIVATGAQNINHCVLESKRTGKTA